MTDLQLKTLQSLLRITQKTPPQHRLEEIKVALQTRLQLYLQEEDKAGAKVYQELKKLIETKTLAQLEKMGDPVTS